jgi:hypothetical protein
MNNRIEIYQDIVKNELMTMAMMDMMLGKYLGRGIHRMVFEYALDKKYVVKLDDSGKGMNFIEHDVWKRIQFTRHAKWFAPIKSVSTNGIIMLQRKCEKLEDWERPKKVPAFFTDTHSDNFGKLDGRPVCFDYALNLLMEQGMTSKLKKPRWTEGTRSFS